MVLTHVKWYISGKSRSFCKFGKHFSWAVELSKKLMVIKIIDVKNSTVIPGLIDCHDHIASFGYDIAGRWGLVEPQSKRHMRIASVLRTTLESGYTTLRDAGGLPAGIREAISEDFLLLYLSLPNYIVCAC